MLTVLHTSDWHLGRRLYGKPRYTEFRAFLAWLLQAIREQAVDVLVVAGDVFDTTAPSNQAQNLYYDFLSQVCQTCCRHVIIVAGNHDSPSFLEAPKQLLKSFNIHIIGSMSEYAPDEVITLYDAAGHPELIIMAVPYLRDRDVRQVSSGERLDDKERKLSQGIQRHYQDIAAIALQQQAQLKRQYNRTIPMVATGHLFTVGGKTTEGDGVRELYVGSLGSVGADVFHPNIDYVALGHLHVPQTVGNAAHIRYSGSPIAMGFGESRQQKQVHLLRFAADPQLLNQPIHPLTTQLVATENPQPSTPTLDPISQHGSMDLFADEVVSAAPVTAHPHAPYHKPYNVAKLSDTTLLQSLCVPTFQPLQTIKGDWQTIQTTLQNLKTSGQSVWLEVVYDGREVMGDLSEKITRLIEGTALEVLRLKNLQKRDQLIKSQRLDETLEEMNEKQVFARCLAAHGVTEAQQPMLWARYGEVLDSLQDDQP